MIVSYNTLAKYVNLDGVDAYKLGDLLTNAGLEVEQVRPFTQGSDLVIGYVKDAYEHPKSEKLTVCITDVGNGEELQICCGATNVGKGMYVIVAKPGCKLDYAKVPIIKKVELAGVESNGMICSLTEIGIAHKFQTQEQIEGIEVLEGEYNIGDEALTTLGLDDYVLDISLTPNRSDAYSIYALAIEVAALLNRQVKNMPMNVECDIASKYSISIEDEACLSYGLFSYDNIISKSSSTAVVNELMALGFKSRSNIVDMGNMAMVVSGNPIHTFDADKLKSKEFIIKKGLEVDDFLALDDKTYKIIKDDLLIMNGDEIVAIAGIIGSKSSCIDDDTKNVVVEAANFDHVSIRNTARRLDLFSESSTRYSKIINAYTLEFSIRHFEDSLGLECTGVNKVDYPTYKAIEIELSHDKIEKVLGIKIAMDDCVSILKKLSFKVVNDENKLVAYPPSYRKDVRIAADVIEEIIRVYGYENINSTQPIQEIDYKEITSIQSLENTTRDILVGFGLQEIVSYQLSSPEKLSDFSDSDEYLFLENPISEDRKCFRNQLLSGMVETMLHNKSYQHVDQSLFEISHVYFDGVEKTQLSIGMMGLFNDNSWQGNKQNVDFYLLKGIVLSWLEKNGFSYGRVLIKPVESNHKYMHPTKAAYLTMNNKNIGVFGEIHPTIAKKMKLKNTYVATIDLTFLSENVGRSNKYTSINLLPSVRRDLSLVVPNNVNAEDIIKLAKTGNNKLIKDVKIFDVYYGEGLAENHYSMSISLMISDDKKTLKEEEINEVVNNILSNFEKKLSVTLRK